MRTAWRYRSRKRATVTFSALFAAAFLIANAGFPGPAPAAQASKEGKKDASGFIRLAPIQVPIIVNRQVVGQAGVLVQLQLTDPRDFDAVDTQRARLLDAFLSELYGLFDQLEDRPVLVDPAIVKEHLGRVSDRILGPGKIRDIDILRTYEQRNRS